ncbi:MAG: hypothetical protein ABWX84_07755 [Nocardioides sp.]
MNIKDSSRHGLTCGLASILVAGGSVFFASAAVADQACGDGGTTATYTGTGYDRDDYVALRKDAMSRAWAHVG